MSPEDCQIKPGKPGLRGVVTRFLMALILASTVACKASEITFPTVTSGHFVGTITPVGKGETDSRPLALDISPQGKLALSIDEVSVPTVVKYVSRAEVEFTADWGQPLLFTGNILYGTIEGTAANADSAVYGWYAVR